MNCSGILLSFGHIKSVIVLRKAFLLGDEFTYIKAFNFVYSQVVAKRPYYKCSHMLLMGNVIREL
ncbi:CLUMA_CG020228, isoform A [Clunio marinus]|uniref:CLUMA_CG020228, isoform A n=1 Tax=Clunio marinus TaxID=568069 RepID=A0A1J1J4B9_9DIPT|nr:CLUMA_CG020228, isoform A [Clunio marinus]